MKLVASLSLAGALGLAAVAHAAPPVHGGTPPPAAPAPAAAPAAPAAPTHTAPLKAGKVSATWWGQAAFVIRTPGGAVIAIDPWFKNPKAPANAPWPEAVDAILVTHGHFDHVGDTVELAAKTGATVVAPYELAVQLGTPKINPMNAGGSFKVKDVTITVVPAIHSSGFVANPADQTAKPVYGGNPVGYILQVDKGPTLYHAGDTDVFSEMSIIADRFKPSIALLPIGGQFTMGPEGAAYAAKLLKVKTVVPMHFATFEALKGTPAELTAALKKEKSSAKVQELQIGTPTEL
jgi:L-ascorbate metabolism protein UlaG (beta-lactamase superfamily)